MVKRTKALVSVRSFRKSSGFVCVRKEAAIRAELVSSPLLSGFVERNVFQAFVSCMMIKDKF